MKKSLLLTLCLTLTSMISAFAFNYKVNVTPGEIALGSKAELLNYDTGEVIASTDINDATVSFVGELDEPCLVRLDIDGIRPVEFILEEGTIDCDALAMKVKGGKLNKIFSDIDSQAQGFAAEYNEAETEERQAEIYDEYLTFLDKELAKNSHNPIGYMIFLQKAYDMEPAELIAYVDENPYFKKFQRVNKLIEANKNKLATSEGGKFRDFEIEYDGVKHRLSDVVGKGDYVLVDFWASWCGPCIRQTAVLKDIYNDYNDKGLKILGVAVWDEPENTLEAIKQHELPWECWINGQSIPTDEYGISGIPCIILFAPDGTILSRDKQSDELKADVAKALGAKN